MSGVFRSVGKVFKKVAKVVKKVAVPALIIGAVVLTGGAALGVLPALGTTLASVGITGTMASVMGGAISGAAIGAGMGGLSAAVTGGNVWKGAMKGGVTGGLTGGVMGAAGMVSPNGFLSDMGIGSKVSHLQGLAAQGNAAAARELASLGQAIPTQPGSAAAAKALASGNVPAAEIGVLNQGPLVQSAGAQGLQLTPTAVGDVVGGAAQAASTAATAAPPLAAAAPTVVKAGGGLLNSPMAMMAAGQVVSGIGSGMAAKADANTKAAMTQNEIAMSMMPWGLTPEWSSLDKSGNPTRNARMIGSRQTYQFGQVPRPAAQPAAPTGGLIAGGAPAPYQIIGNKVYRFLNGGYVPMAAG